MDKKTKQLLLKPLAKRKNQNNTKELITALDRLDERAVAEDFLAEVRELLIDARREKKSEAWKDHNIARKQVLLAQALLASRRISRQEFVFFASLPVENIHESRWFDGLYLELQPIQQAIDAVREQYGLSPDEYWRQGEGPDDYIILNKQYDEVHEKYFIQTLREFGLNELANIREQNPDEFDRLRERGRRSVHHKEDVTAALKDTVIHYEEDARRAASAKAYSAAVTLLGAGVEGILLLRCLKSKQKAQRIASKLPKRLRPRNIDDPTKWNFETLIETCLASGWLPPICTSVAKYQPAGLAHILRLMRNYVHPGVQRQ